MTSSQPIKIYMQTVDELIKHHHGTIYVVASLEPTAHHCNFYLNVTAVNSVNHVMLYRSCTGTALKNFDEQMKDEGKKLDEKYALIWAYISVRVPVVAAGVINPDKPMDGHPFKETPVSNERN